TNGSNGTNGRGSTGRVGGNAVSGLKVLRSRFSFHFAPGFATKSIFQQIPQEEKVVAEVARTEAAGFGPEAEDPGQTEALHPGGGIGLHAGIDVEGETYGEDNAASEQGFVAFD